ncbi:hypothetical protein BDB01DRAFT_894252 [Pilobolus umbonatus]|nr:hypothetical protein BDB01DRAFT_894252 [Pilobolus umbonatus]
MVAPIIHPLDKTNLLSTYEDRIKSLNNNNAGIISDGDEHDIPAKLSRDLLALMGSNNRMSHLRDRDGSGYLCIALSESEGSYDIIGGGHHNAMRAGVGHWFNTPDCSQIIADAFSVPVCLYPDVAEKGNSSVTYFTH